jgi:hypothetical protein
MKRSRWIHATVAAVSVGAACANDSTGNAAQAGTLRLRLTSPHDDDGAMVFEVAGPPIDSATAGNTSLQLFTQRVDGTTMVGAVVGALGNGVVVTLHVPDVTAVAGYRARVIEVANKKDALRDSLTGYALSVTP